MASTIALRRAAATSSLLNKLLGTPIRCSASVVAPNSFTRSFCSSDNVHEMTAYDDTDNGDDRDSDLDVDCRRDSQVSNRRSNDDFSDYCYMSMEEFCRRCNKGLKTSCRICFFKRLPMIEPKTDLTLCKASRQLIVKKRRKGRV